MIHAPLDNLLQLFGKLFRKPTASEQPIKVLLVNSGELTLDQWRKDTRLVASAKEMARHEVFRMMVAVLENSHVRFLSLPIVGSTNDSRAALHERSVGYQMVLNNIEAMTKDITVGQMPRETFRPPQPTARQ